MEEIVNRRMTHLLQVLYDRAERGETFEVVIGKRYVRVVKITPSRVAGYPPLKHTHCYIEAHSGRVFKPASCTHPAPGVRYELKDGASYDRLLKEANPDGNYLL